MAWIKRNLYFVITLAVGLGLTGYCVYLLFSALDANTSASDQYATAKSSLEELQNKKPFPSKENIQAAEKDQVRVRAFLAEFRKPFALFPVPPKVDDRQFKDYLQQTVIQFGLDATNSEVGVTPGYAFSWAQQITKLNYPSESIAPWMQELEEEKAILHILYNAKINFLYKIKRPSVSAEDVGGDDYTPLGSVSNQWGVVTPYMLTFRAFSTEIANVLAGIAASSNCFIVKAIYVSADKQVQMPQWADLQPKPAPTIQYRQPRPERLPDQFMPEGGRFMQEGGRYDRGMRGERMAPRPIYTPPAAVAPVIPAGPVTILTETPLFVTIYIDVVKLKAMEAPAAATGAAAKARRRGP